MFVLRRRTLSTSLRDLRRLFSVSYFKEEEGFGATGRGGSEVMADEEGKGGGLSKGAGAGVLDNSSGSGSLEDDPLTGGGISTAVWPFGGSTCKLSV